MQPQFIKSCNDSHDNDMTSMLPELENQLAGNGSTHGGMAQKTIAKKYE